jgi:hypothetical protein
VLVWGLTQHGFAEAIPDVPAVPDVPVEVLEPRVEPEVEPVVDPLRLDEPDPPEPLNPADEPEPPVDELPEPLTPADDPEPRLDDPDPDPPLTVPVDPGWSRQFWLENPPLVELPCAKPIELVPRTRAAATLKMLNRFVMNLSLSAERSRENGDVMLMSLRMQASVN